MNSLKAFSSTSYVTSAAEEFVHIADALHRRLNASSFQAEASPETTDLYGLLVEEYGLRTRAAILRNSAAAHVVSNANLDQSALISVLQSVVAAIPSTTHLSTLRSLIAGVSTLCVSVSPGKGKAVDFLAQELEAEVRANSSAKT